MKTKTDGELSLGSAAGANAETDIHGEAPADARRWCVTVERYGELVITISDSHMCGRDISPADEEAIEIAANNLLGFIGRCASVDTWQPIETHDGSPAPVLVADGDGACGGVVEAYFSAEHNTWWELNSVDDGAPGSDRRVHPTHWMPLPPPPRAVDGGAPRTSTKPQSQATTTDETQR